MGKRINILNKSISLLNSPEEKWFFVFFFTAFIPVFLIIFQPFGVNNYDPSHSIDRVFLFACVGFGIVCGITLGVYEFLLVPKLFKSGRIPQFLLRIALGILLTSVTLFWFYNYLGNYHDWHFSSLLGFIRDVGALYLVPISIVLLILGYRKTLKAYEVLNIAPGESVEAGLIWLEDSNSSNRIAIAPADLLFIQAQDNYVSIHHSENDKVKKTLLRTTMRKLESQLKPLQIIRCHRSYLVNLGAINKIHRSAHHYLLYLNEIDIPIPVSRSYIPVLDRVNTVRHI